MKNNSNCQTQPPLSDDNLLTHRFNITEDRVVEINKSNNGAISANIIDINGNKKEIKSEHLPKELTLINDPLKLGEYLKSVWAKTSKFDNGDEELNLYARLKGGMYQEELEGLDEVGKLNKRLKDYDKLELDERKRTIELVRQEITSQRNKFNQKIAWANCNLDNLNLIVGATRSGKSTMFNYINELPLIVEKLADSNRTVLSVDLNNLTEQQARIYAPIGHNFNSETSIPNFAKSPISDYVYVDCAGEFDSKDVLQSIVNSYFKSDLTDLAKNVKLTLVIPASNLKPSGSGYFRKVLKEIGKFINDWDQFIKKGSISLAITAVEVGRNKQNFLDEIIKLTQQVKDLGKFKDVLLDVVKREAIGLFYKPDTRIEQEKQRLLKIALKKFDYLTTKDPKYNEEEKLEMAYIKANGQNIPNSDSESESDSEDKIIITREEILARELISSNKYISTFSPKELSTQIEERSKALSQSGNIKLFSMSLQDNAQDVINTIAHDLACEIDKEVLDTTLQIIKDKILERMTSGITPDFKMYMQKCDKASSVDNLLNILEINKNQKLINLEKDVDTFSKLSTKYRVDHNNFDNLKIRLLKMIGDYQAEFKELCDRTTSIHDGDTLRISGFAPSINEVSRNLKPTTKSIEITGTYKVTINNDLVKEKMSGINLTIITNIIDVIGDREINLSGLDQTFIYKKAFEEKCGEPGLPGNNGGNLFIYANKINNGDKLTVISNGGKGGHGQNGGDRKNNNLEKNITWDLLKKKEGVHLYDVDSYRDLNLPYYNWAEEYDDVYNSKVFVFTNEAAHKNRHGYDGGKGGVGGLPGDIEIIGLEEDNRLLQVINHNGKEGKGGYGSQGVGSEDIKSIELTMYIQECCRKHIYWDEKEDSEVDDFTLTVKYFSHFCGTKYTFDSLLKRLGKLEDYKFLKDIANTCGSKDRETSLNDPNLKYLSHASGIFRSRVLIGWRNATVSLSGRNGKDGANGDIQNLPLSNKIAFNQVILRIKENLISNINNSNNYRKFTTDLIEQLETNKEVLKKASTVALVKELQSLENNKADYEKKGINIIPHFESLQARIIDYSRMCDDQEGIKVLNYIYTNILSNIVFLKGKDQPNLVIDIEKYFRLVGENISSLQSALGKRATINHYKKEYQDNIDGKIKEAIAFTKSLNAAIDKTKDEIDNKIDTVLSEIKEMQKDAEKNGFELIKNKKKLKELMTYNLVFGVLKTATLALGFIGPVGMVAAGAINLGLGVAQGMVCKDPGTPNLLEIPQGILNQGIFDGGLLLEEKAFNKQMRIEDDAFKLQSIQEKIRNDNIDVQNVGLNEERDRISERIKQGKIVRDAYLFNPNTTPNTSENNNLEIMNAMIEEGEKHLLNIDNQVNNNLNLKENPEQSEIRRDAQLKTVKEGAKLTKRLQQAQVGLNVAISTVDIFNKYQHDGAKLSQIDQSIKANKEQIVQIKKHEQAICDLSNKTIKNMKNSITLIQGDLVNQSHVALDVQKWQVNQCLSDIKRHMQALTKGMKVEDGLANTMEKMIIAIETNIGIYDRIQDFQDQALLANYIAHIESPDVQGLRLENEDLQQHIDKLDASISQNLILEQYTKAENAFKQWAFPFANVYKKEFSSIEKLEDHETLNDKAEEANNTINKLRTKIEESFNSIVSIDKVIHSGEFYNTKHSDPFYTWSGKKYASSISDLLQGKKVSLNAKITNDTKSAVKFTEIGIKLTSNIKSIQAKLDEAKDYYTVRLKHQGASYYKYDNQVYKMGNTPLFIEYSFGESKNGSAPADSNAVYKKLAEGNPMLSPYGVWEIQIVTANVKAKKKKKALKFDLSSEEIKDVKVRLVGKGYYVDEQTIIDNKLDKGKNLKDLKLDNHYKSVLTLDILPSTKVCIIKRINNTNLDYTNKFLMGIEEKKLKEEKMQKEEKIVKEEKIHEDSHSNVGSYLSSEDDNDV